MSLSGKSQTLTKTYMKVFSKFHTFSSQYPNIQKIKKGKNAFLFQRFMPQSLDTSFNSNGIKNFLRNTEGKHKYKMNYRKTLE